MDHARKFDRPFSFFYERNRGMSQKLDHLEAELMKLDTKSRARLAEKLIKSLDALSDAENAELWAEEAQRRDAEMDADPSIGRSAEEVMRDARSRIS
jgi:hypothetical protein